MHLKDEHQNKSSYCNFRTSRLGEISILENFEIWNLDQFSIISPLYVEPVLSKISMPSCSVLVEGNKSGLWNDFWHNMGYNEEDRGDAIDFPIFRPDTQKGETKDLLNTIKVLLACSICWPSHRPQSPWLPRRLWTDPSVLTNKKARKMRLYIKSNKHQHAIFLTSWCPAGGGHENSARYQHWSIINYSLHHLVFQYNADKTSWTILLFRENFIQEIFHPADYVCLILSYLAIYGKTWLVVHTTVKE